MAYAKLSKNDSAYIDLLRGISIIRVVLVHLGLSWIFPPYSEVIHVFLPILFFVSGAVSVFSFYRADSVTDYLLKRLISTSVPYFVVIFISFSVIWILNKKIPEINYYIIYQWITFNPIAVPDTMPFPLGQVWFLHVLVILTLISPAFFILAKKNTNLLIIPILISLFFGSIQHYKNIGTELFLDQHNFYQTVSNMGFYFFGAYYYQNKEKFTNRVWLALISSSIIIIICLIFFVNKSNSMSHHSYHPDLFYILSSFCIIFIFLCSKNAVETVINKIILIKSILNFSSRHSFSIYLLHSLLVYWSEIYLGLIGVMNSPVLATFKIIFVFLGTAILSIPTSFITKKISRKIRYFLIEKRKLS